MPVDWTPIAAGAVGAAAAIGGTMVTARTQLRSLRLEHAEAERRDEAKERQEAVVAVLTLADDLMARARGAMVKGAQLSQAAADVRAFVVAQGRLELIVGPEVFNVLTPYIESVTYYVNYVQAPSEETRRQASNKLDELDLWDGEHVDALRDRYLGAARDALGLN